ncbi:MAG: VanZ family protein [Bacteroidales bacterium]
MLSKSKKIVIILFCIYLCLVFFLCFLHLGAGANVTMTKEVMGIRVDRILHFLLFFPFPILAGMIIYKKDRKPVNTILYAVGIFLTGCVLAGATELGQSLTSYRSCNVNDFRADALSLAISTLTLLIVIMFKKPIVNV